MDGLQFDQMTRTLYIAGTRRRMLSLLADVPFLGLLATWLGEENAGARRERVKDQRKKKRKKRKKKCAKAGQPTSKKRKHCCKGLVKGAAGRCTKPACDVCASGCSFTSVQAAVDAASSGETIRICAGTYFENITIDGDLTLIGAGNGDDPAVDTILDGNGSGSVVVVDGATVALQGLRLTHGSDLSNGGGGLRNNEGAVTMRVCTVIDNVAGWGGGIYTTHGSLTLRTCTVSGNAADDGGGGIDVNECDVVLDASEVTGNFGGFAGGGIWINGDTLTMTGCSVAENQAHLGGGIAQIGTCTMILDASDVTGNIAEYVGGGIYNTDVLKLLNGSSVTDNEAGDPPPSGGGIMNSGTIDASGGSITGNMPDQCVGGTGCP